MSARIALPALAPLIVCLILATPEAFAHTSIVPDSTAVVAHQAASHVGQIAPDTQAYPLPTVADPPPPSLWGTLVILIIAAPCGWALWRWRLLMPRPNTSLPALQTSDVATEESDRLRLRLEGATLLVAGLCVWISQSIGAAIALSAFSISPDDAKTTKGVALLSAGAYSAALIAGVLALIALPGMARRIGLAPRLNAAASGVLLFALVFPVVLAIGSIAMWCSWLIALVLDVPGPDSVAHETLRTLVDPSVARDLAWWGAIAAVVIGAPLAEEFIYRGCLQSAIDRTFRGFGLVSGWRPVVITSVFFALAHVGIAEPRAWITLMVLSLAFGAAYQRTGRLVTPFLMHALFNAANIAIAL